MSVEIKGVSKRYGKVVALDEIKLSIEKGEFFVILGPSGSGKTTLLRVLAGLETVDRGEIILDGRDVTRVPASRREVAMVFQNYALYPHKTVMENLTMPVESEMSREEARELAESIARKLNIAELLNRYPNELSGGQQQKVALARALMKRPKLFLMDEPLSNLDAIQRISARKLIKDIQRDNSITTVYVTHDQVEAMQLADRVGIMDSGRLIQVGTPEEVYNNVANDFVASFFGNPPMSLLSGEFLGIKGRIGIRPEDVVIGEGELRGRVSEVEFWGDRYLVYLEINGSEMRAFHGSRLRVGEQVRFTVRRYSGPWDDGK